MGKIGAVRRRASAIGVLVASSVLVLGLVAPPAHADYAPRSQDVVGVGSDTVMFALDFLADGFTNGAPGYNFAGNVNKLVSFDAIPDANARLAYGVNGGSGTCTPGTGGTQGTGNLNGTHAEGTPVCTLNPTIVLQAGTNPVQRMNGSGAGFAALINEMNKGPRPNGCGGAGTDPHLIDFTRSSSAQNTGVCHDVLQIQLGSDPFFILTAQTTNYVPLSTDQLKAIYSANTPNCLTWGQVDDGSTGNTVPAPGATIDPVIPQAGSGTRSAFLGQIGNPTLGTCATQNTHEENDPFAVVGDPNAIEPMSGGRLNLFQGKSGTGGSFANGYFKDPSCKYLDTSVAPACTTGAFLTPDVTGQTTGTPFHGTIGGNTFGTLPVWNQTRPLYVYLRQSDVEETAPFGTNHPFQPGSTLNWVRALFYNPCSTGQTGCITISGTQYGPGGQPFFAKSQGQALIADAGIPPTYVVTPNV